MCCTLIKLFINNFYKSKHFIWSVLVIFFINSVVGLKIPAPKLIYLETAFIYVKMNISFFKIWVHVSRIFVSKYIFSVCFHVA